MLKKLYIDNYKSFSDAAIEFGQFNCLIGPNNAGKSNLIDVLEFLDIVLFRSIDEAVKEKSSNGLISNYRENNEVITINAEFQLSVNGRVNYDLIVAQFTLSIQMQLNAVNATFVQDISLNGKLKHIKIKQQDYKFAQDSTEMSAGLALPVTPLQIKNYEQYEAQYNKMRFKPFAFNVNKTNEKTKVVFGEKQSIATNKTLLEFFCYDYKTNLQGDIISCDIDFASMFISDNLLGSYFFNTYLIKNNLKYAPELDKYGMTLINYLNLLKKHNETIFNEIAYSFIGEIELINGIESTTNYNLPKLEFVETGVEYPIDYREASDGTIHFLAIMTALKAVDKKIIAIEEPERSLHMRTLYYIVSQCRNSNKQIFITTHSSELLKMLKPQEISFVYRDRNGNSKVKMASQIPYLSKMMKRTKYDIVELIQTGIIGNFEDDE
ncbi:MAG: hypothetical protein RL154_234 [Pseudomonadota bacterium]